MIEMVFDLQRFLETTTSVSKATVRGTAGNDSIKNDGGSYVAIYGEGGDDKLLNKIGNHVTLYGGEGNDSLTCVTSIGYNSLEAGNTDNVFDGGNGNDTIKVEVAKSGTKTTLEGGKGNDSISAYWWEKSSTDVIKYTSGDGTDTVIGFGADDTLQFISDSAETLVSGNNFVISDKKGSITFTNGAKQIGSNNVIILPTIANGLEYADLKGTKITAKKSFGGKFDMSAKKYSKVKIFDGSASTKKLKINGNKLANKITGGKIVIRLSVKQEKIL